MASTAGTTFVKIHGNQRIPFESYRSFRLKHFTRHYVAGLNLYAEVHYNREDIAARDRYVHILDRFGGFLKQHGVTVRGGKMKVLLLPMHSLNDRPRKRGKNWIEVPWARLMPVMGQYSYPNKVFVAVRPDKEISDHWLDTMKKHGEKSVTHEITHALSADLSESTYPILKIGVALCDADTGEKHRMGLNEALTEYVTHRFYTELTGEKINPGYDCLVEGIELLGNKIGFKPLLEALFFNDLAPIEAALARSGFPADAMEQIIEAAEKDHEQFEKKQAFSNAPNYLVNYVSHHAGDIDTPF